MAKALTTTDTSPRPADAGYPRQSNGRFMKGFSASPGGDGGRARRKLNTCTIEAMQRAFDRGGQKAIDKVMVGQPALFLKMLVLLVPREMQIEHSGDVKRMSDDQIAATIAAIEDIIARRVAGATPGDNAKVIEGEVIPEKPKRKRARRDIPGTFGA